MKKFEQEIYHSYHTSHTKHLYGEKTIEKIEAQFPVYEYYFGKYLPADKEVSIIDLGCGSGEFVHWLNIKGYMNAKGIDISKELIDIGNSLGIKNITQNDLFSFLGNNIENINVFVLRDVLEHFNKDETYQLAELLFRNLNEGGTLLLQVPNGQSPFVGKILFGDFTHHTAFTESSLNQIFISLGFRKITVSEAAPVPKNLRGGIRLFFWKILRLFIKAAHIISTGNGSGYYSSNIIAIIKK